MRKIRVSVQSVYPAHKRLKKRIKSINLMELTSEELSEITDEVDDLLVAAKKLIKKIKSTKNLRKIIKYWEHFLADYSGEHFLESDLSKVYEKSVKGEVNQSSRVLKGVSQATMYAEYFENSQLKVISEDSPTPRDPMLKKILKLLS